MSKQYHVYIMTNRKDGTLYIGVSGDIIGRVAQHRERSLPGFTKKYNLTRLVHIEAFDDPENAILREKRLKKWNRAWKVDLIESTNPNWDDLYPALVS